jgi:hypothetical protein
MSSETRELMQKLPLQFLAYTTASGLVLLYLSPLRELFPSWMQNPFSLNPPDILAGFLVIFICSFCMGIPMHFARGLLVGENGINSLAMVAIKRKEKPPKLTHEKRIEINQKSMDMVNWLQEKKLTFISDFFLMEQSFVAAFIAGSEVASWFNLAYLANLWYGQYSFLTLVGSLALFAISILYNRYHFRAIVSARWNALERMKNSG